MGHTFALSILTVGGGGVARWWGCGSFSGLGEEANMTLVNASRFSGATARRSLQGHQEGFRTVVCESVYVAGC